MKLSLSFILVGLLSTNQLIAQVKAPAHLTTDLLEHTDVVFQDGNLSSLPIAERGIAIERHQIAAIRNTRPSFGWVIESTSPNTNQTAYRVLLTSGNYDGSVIWDSGKVESDNSNFIQYGGPELTPGTLYSWKVKVWDNHGNESPFSDSKAFWTADTLDNTTSYYPLQLTTEFPSKIKRINGCETFIEFERTAFGKLNVTLTSSTGRDTVSIHLGERCENGRLYRKPKDSKSSIRYSEYILPLKQGTHTYAIKINPDKRNTDLRRTNESGVAPVLMPDYIGEVYPFRYCEINGYEHPLKTNDIYRQSSHYPFNDFASYFDSSDSILNQVWDMCKYTVKATSFTGIYVDGDRERIAYEADAILGQLGHYATDREFSMARRSHEYLLENPTWPTEWNLQSVIIAWNDYLYTGDDRSLIKYYDTLKAKTLSSLREENGLISTRTGKVSPEVHKSLNFKGKKLKDIVDWPQQGYVGNEKERPGEADGFVRTTYNNVVNSYHYYSLVLMAKIAAAVGNNDDARIFTHESERVKKQFNTLLFNKTTGHYKDGVETDHESLHGNMFPLAFGLVPENRKNKVIDYIKSRRMACSVYGAQFLIDALYQANEGDYALQLLSSDSERSWYNMLRAGSTIGMEAWDDKYKPNQDWNHVWGAAPANLIPRGLFGIQPIEPGFKVFQIKPQPGSLEWAKIKVPTIRGDINTSFKNTGECFEMEVTIPVNSLAQIYIPSPANKPVIKVDGIMQKASPENGFIKLNLESGDHQITVTKK